MYKIICVFLTPYCRVRKYTVLFTHRNSSSTLETDKQHEVMLEQARLPSDLWRAVNVSNKVLVTHQLARSTKSGRSHFLQQEMKIKTTRKSKKT